MLKQNSLKIFGLFCIALGLFSYTKVYAASSSVNVAIPSNFSGNQATVTVTVNGTDPVSGAPVSDTVTLNVDVTDPGVAPVCGSSFGTCNPGTASNQNVSTNSWSCTGTGDYTGTTISCGGGCGPSGRTQACGSATNACNAGTQTCTNGVWSSCVFPGQYTSCNADSNSCTAGDHCDGAGNCAIGSVTGTRLACSNNACVAIPNTASACTNTCTTNADCVAVHHYKCSGNACVQDDVNGYYTSSDCGYACMNIAPTCNADAECNDGNPCHRNQCIYDSSGGRSCNNSNSPDGTSCGVGSVCQAGVCAYTTQDFGISISPGSQTAYQGSPGTANYTVTVSSDNNFSGGVSLSAGATCPANATCSFSQPNVSVPAGGSATSNLSVTYNASIAIQTYNLTVTGTAGALSHTASSQLQVGASLTSACDNAWHDIAGTSNSGGPPSAIFATWPSSMIRAARMNSSYSMYSPSYVYVQSCVFNSGVSQPCTWGGGGWNQYNAYHGGPGSYTYPISDPYLDNTGVYWQDCQIDLDTGWCNTNSVGYYWSGFGSYPGYYSVSGPFGGQSSVTDPSGRVWGFRSSAGKAQYQCSSLKPTIGLGTPPSFSGQVGGSPSPASAVLPVSETSGTTALVWKATTNQGWCHVNVGDGLVQGGVWTNNRTVNAGATDNSTLRIIMEAPGYPGLVVGTNTCRVTIDAPTASNNQQYKDVTYTITSPPPPPATPNPISAANSGVGIACSQVKVTWTDVSTNETGFRVYRQPSSGGAVATVKDQASSSGGSTGQVYSFVDTPPDPAQTYNYWVTAYNLSAESPRNNNSLAINSPVGVMACAANMATSEKDIVAVNGVNLSNAPYGTPNGGTDSLPGLGVKSLKVDDVLTFSILLRNQGTATASGISITDNMINLVVPATGWNAKYQGAALVYDGTQPGGYSPAVGHYAALGSLYNQSLVFNLASASYNIPAPVSPSTEVDRGLTFDAKIAVSSSYGGSIPRFQNSFVGVYNNGNMSGTTPLIPFNKSKSGPQIIEIP